VSWPLDVNALLLILRDEMTIIRNVIGSFVTWPKELITLDVRVCLSKLKYNFKF